MFSIIKTTFDLLPETSLRAEYSTKEILSSNSWVSHELWIKYTLEYSALDGRANFCTPSGLCFRVHELTLNTVQFLQPMTSNLCALIQVYFDNQGHPVSNGHTKGSHTHVSKSRNQIHASYTLIYILTGRKYKVLPKKSLEYIKISKYLSLPPTNASRSWLMKGEFIHRKTDVIVLCLRQFRTLDLCIKLPCVCFVSVPTYFRAIRPQIPWISQKRPGFHLFVCFQIVISH